ncbi:MAG TPA: hypothetical protein VJA25_06715 [Dehalococcoidia bacterium]|nr:hypothetical protein [Dehalococcoidia bacterium]
MAGRQQGVLRGPAQGVPLKPVAPSDVLAEIVAHYVELVYGVHFDAALEPVGGAIRALLRGAVGATGDQLEDLAPEGRRALSTQYTRLFGEMPAGWEPSPLWERNKVEGAKYQYQRADMLDDLAVLYVLRAYEDMSPLEEEFEAYEARVGAGVKRRTGEQFADLTDAGLADVYEGETGERPAGW